MSGKLDYINMIKKVSPYNLKKGILYLRHYGPKGFWIKLTERFQKSDIDYKEWYENHRPSEQELERERKQVFEYSPKISILVPVYNTPEVFLKQMIQSVRKQTYTNWELCIANANPSNQEVSSILNVAGKKDNRIKVVDVPENEGIAQNTNRALEIATGEFVGLLDHDDLLEENALYEIVSCLNKDRKTDVLYTDEDKVTTDLDEYFSPNFKPDFNLDMLRANNYICHFSAIRADLMKKLQFRSNYDGAQDYDLFLRAVYEIGKEGPKDTEGRLLYPQVYMDRKIAHIPQICYHWRAHLGSTADNPQSKLYAYEAGKRALEDFARQNGWQAEICHTNHLGFYRIDWKDIFVQRPDVVAVCSNECRRGRVAESGTLPGAKYGEHVFAGLKKRYSGYLHRASMTVDVTDPPLQQTIYRKDAEQKQGRIVYLPGSKQ